MNRKILFDFVFIVIFCIADYYIFINIQNPHQCALYPTNAINRNAVCYYPHYKKWYFCSVNTLTANILCSNTLAPNPLTPLKNISYTLPKGVSLP